MSNERAADGAEVAAVEAPAVEARNDPEASRRHDVLAIGPRFERASAVIFKLAQAVGDEFPIDLNSMPCNLHSVAKNSGDRLQQRRASIGAAAAQRAVTTFDGDC